MPANEKEFFDIVAAEIERINDLDEPPTVAAEDSIVDDLELDSLGMLELVLRLQSAYSVSLSEEEVIGAKTAGDLLDLVNSKDPVRQ
ncbi:acyl carrier protein [Nocardia sp. NPDC049149]|uniref:acyl carrier protein n=1 Tax=Nocardia sp. NPDC049149 TaxID=3364315 RepID=UPI0037162B98